MSSWDSGLISPKAIACSATVETSRLACAGGRAHLTIARAQRVQKAGRLLQALDTYESREFVVPEVALVESRLATRVHEVLHRAILRG